VGVGDCGKLRFTHCKSYSIIKYMAPKTTQGKCYVGTYDSIHKWLAKNHKKVGMCTMCKNVERRTEFALLRNKKHDYNYANYIELCVPCHRAYDWDDDKNNKFSQRKRIPHVWQYKAVIRTDHNGNTTRYESVTAAAKILGGGWSQIVNALKGRYKKSYNSTWKYEAKEC